MYTIEKIAENYPILSEEQEKSLFYQYKVEGNLEAAKKLVLHYARLVIREANRFRGYVRDVEELHQEGMCGLMKAIKSFDPNRGVRLVTYAVHKVREAIANFCVKNYRIFNVATTKAQRKLFFNANATAEELDVSDKDYEDFQLRKSSEVTVDDSEVLQLVSSIPTPEEHILATEEYRSVERLKEAVGGLRDRERTIIESRYLSDEPRTLQDLGLEFNISAERVRQIENETLKKLRRIYG